MAWGVNNKILDRKKFLPVIKKAWTGLNTLVHDDGASAGPSRSARTQGKISMSTAGKFTALVRICLAGSEVAKLKLQ